MTKTEIKTIENVLARLRKPRLGCVPPMPPFAETVAPGYEAVSRLYLETWIIFSLQALLPGENRDPDLAEKVSQ